jgi:hypothetical protein
MTKTVTVYVAPPGTPYNDIQGNTAPKAIVNIAGSGTVASASGQSRLGACGTP